MANWPWTDFIGRLVGAPTNEQPESDGRGANHADAIGGAGLLRAPVHVGTLVTCSGTLSKSESRWLRHRGPTSRAEIRYAAIEAHLDVLLSGIDWYSDSTRPTTTTGRLNNPAARVQ